MLRALADDACPARLVGLVEIALVAGGSKVSASTPALVCRSVSSAFALAKSAIASFSPSSAAFCRIAFCCGVSLSQLALLISTETSAV